MQLTEQIDARVAGLASAIDERAVMLAERTPGPLDALVRRVGAVNAEAVRQSGRLTITVLDAAGDVATVAWKGMGGVVDTTGRSLESSTTVLRDTGRRVVGDARQASSTISNRARTAASSVEHNLRVVGGRAEDVAEGVGDEGEAAARRAAKAADTAVASTMETGGSRPSGPYESWTKDELYERAQELDLEGRSGMSKRQLVQALRSA